MLENTRIVRVQPSDFSRTKHAYATGTQIYARMTTSTPEAPSLLQKGLREVVL